MPHTRPAHDPRARSSLIRHRRSLLLLVLVGTVLSFLFSVPSASARASTATTLPYSDPNAKGVIGLCDRNGQSIDHGRVTDRPFVWSAVSSVAAPSDYAIDGRTATLYAYQPRLGLDPSQWSGQLMTASARYDNAAHPKAQATDGDYTLEEFLDTFPAGWHGLVQLRLSIGAPGLPQLSRPYAATDIQVSGDSWKVVHGGSVPCNVTNAISIEEIYHTVPTTTAVVAPSAGHAATPAGGTAASSASSSAAGAATSSAGSGSSEAPRQITASAASSSTSTSRTPLVVLILVLIAALLGGGVWAWRRRGGGDGPPDDMTDSQEEHDVTADSVH